MEEATTVKIDVELPFSSKRIAEIVYDVVRVDAEPVRSGVTKILNLEGTVVKVTFTASLEKQLRVGVNNFFEKVDLIIETIEAIGPPTSEKYEFY